MFPVLYNLLRDGWVPWFLSWACGLLWSGERALTMPRRAGISGLRRNQQRRKGFKRVGQNVEAIKLESVSTPVYLYIFVLYF